MGRLGQRATLRQVGSLSLCLLLAPLPAVAAGAYCSAPTLPFCVDAIGAFADERAARRCQVKLEAYLSGVERHANCLLSVAEEEARQRIEEGHQDAAAAREEGKKAAARFECKARGGATCY